MRYDVLEGDEIVSIHYTFGTKADGTPVNILTSIAGVATRVEAEPYYVELNPHDENMDRLGFEEEAGVLEVMELDLTTELFLFHNAHKKQEALQTIYDYLHARHDNASNALSGFLDAADMTVKKSKGAPSRSDVFASALICSQLTVPKTTLHVRLTEQTSSPAFRSHLIKSVASALADQGYETMKNRFLESSYDFVSPYPLIILAAGYVGLSFTPEDMADLNESEDA